MKVYTDSFKANLAEIYPETQYPDLHAAIQNGRGISQLLPPTPQAVMSFNEVRELIGQAATLENLLHLITQREAHHAKRKALWASYRDATAYECRS